MEAQLQRLVDLYTEGDIDRSIFRTRRDALDLQADALRAELAARAGQRGVDGAPATFEDLVTAWEDRGIDFQRQLIDVLLHPIVVHPAGAIRRASDPTWVEMTPRA